MATLAENFPQTVDFDEVLRLAKLLPAENRIQLGSILIEEQDNIYIPDEQKEMVRERIAKYERNPALLIDEKSAMEFINQIT